MRAFGCSAKSRKVSEVGSPDELPKIDDRPPRLDASDRGSERSAAGGFEDQRKPPFRLIGAFDDLVGTAQMAAALGPPDDGGDAGTRPRGDLNRHVPDTAGRTGDQHPLAEQRGAVTQSAQRGQTGDRQSRCLLEAGIVGQCRHAVSRHGRALRPAGIVGQCDDARAGLRPAAVGRLPQHHPADILAGPPAFGADLKQPQLSAIERKGAHLDQRLVGPRLRFGNLAQFDRRGTVRAC